MVDPDPIFSYHLFTPLLLRAQCHELKRASEETTRSTLNTRVLKHLADALGLNWSVLDMKGKIRIDPEWSGQILSLCSTLETLTREQVRFLRRFRAWDHHSVSESLRLMNIAQKCVNSRDLARICAVDGTRGYDPCNYLDRLSLGPVESFVTNSEFWYVAAVRHLYEYTNASPYEIHKVIGSVLGLPGTRDDPADEDVSTTFKVFLGQELLTKVEVWAREGLIQKERTSYNGIKKTGNKTNNPFDKEDSEKMIITEK